jgi:hypothetical protein
MRLLVLGLLLVLSAASPARAIDVVGCPIVIPPGEVGVVQGDFACSGGSSENSNFSIVLQKGARLDLNGHTVTFVDSPETIGFINCESKCEVGGPGTLDVATTSGSAIWVEARGRGYIHDIAIAEFHLGIAAPLADLRLTNVSIDATHAGIVTARRVELDHVDVTLPGGGGPCIEASQAAGRVTGNDVTVSGCDHGIYGTRNVSLSNLSVSASGIGIFSAGRVTLSDSVVTGSDYADIYSGRRPNLVNTTCETSLKYSRAHFGPDGSWNACPGE